MQCRASCEARFCTRQRHHLHQCLHVNPASNAHVCGHWWWQRKSCLVVRPKDILMYRKYLSQNWAGHLMSSCGLYTGGWLTSFFGKPMKYALPGRLDGYNFCILIRRDTVVIEQSKCAWAVGLEGRVGVPTVTSVVSFLSPSLPMLSQAVHHQGLTLSVKLWGYRVSVHFVGISPSDASCSWNKLSIQMVEAQLQDKPAYPHTSRELWKVSEDKLYSMRWVVILWSLSLTKPNLLKLLMSKLEVQSCGVSNITIWVYSKFGWNLIKRNYEHEYLIVVHQTSRFGDSFLISQWCPRPSQMWKVHRSWWTQTAWQFTPSLELVDKSE